MSLDWLTFDNPVTYWWIFLVSVSLVNMTAWLWIQFYQRKQITGPGSNHLPLVTFLSAFYVFGCAFRSFLPRADVQRITLFDTWWSSVFVGRTVATIAELSFVAQWAIVIYFYSEFYKLKWVKNLALSFVPIIVIAEICSWYAVITTHYIGNTIEESLWALTYTLIGICLVFLVQKLKGPLKYSAIIAVIGCILYVSFMVLVDVPMYFNRWQSDIAVGKEYLGFWSGIVDLNTRWVVTRSINDWREEIPWKTLYFSLAVWASLLLCLVPRPQKK